MYAFKVMVSTLIVMMLVLLIWAALKSEKQSGKTVAYLIIIVNALSLAAIWG